MRTLAILLSLPLALNAATAGAQTAPAAVKNPQAEAKLQLFTGPDGRFSVQMPGTPVFETQPIQLKNSTEKVPLNQFFVEMDNNNVSYMLMYSDYPADAANGTPTSILQTVVNASVAGKTSLSQSNISLGSVPGMAFTAKDTDGYSYDVHDYFVNKRLYQLIIVTNQGYKATFRDAFFNSFQIK